MAKKFVIRTEKKGEFMEIDYDTIDINDLDFRGLVDDIHKILVKKELQKHNKHLMYNKKNLVGITMDGKNFSTDEEIINAKRKIILNDII